MRGLATVLFFLAAVNAAADAEADGGLAVSGDSQDHSVNTLISNHAVADGGSAGDASIAGAGGTGAGAGASSTSSAASSTQIASSVSAGADCHPQCSWKCDSPVCDQICDPVCETPKCATTCGSLPCSKCEVKCAQPQCEVSMCCDGKFDAILVPVLFDAM
jgi:hypothetical protein